MAGLCRYITNITLHVSEPLPYHDFPFDVGSFTDDIFEDSVKACKPYVDAKGATKPSPYWAAAVRSIKSVDADIITRDGTLCTCGEGFFCQDTQRVIDNGYGSVLDAGDCTAGGHDKGRK